jgi:hypothetical protein
MTSLLRSPSRFASTDSNRAREKVPEGKRKEVMMTYRRTDGDEGHDESAA